MKEWEGNAMRYAPSATATKGREAQEVPLPEAEGPSWYETLQFPERDAAAHESEVAEYHLSRQDRDSEDIYVGLPRVVLRCADQRHGQRSECVGDGGPLRDGRHWDS